jgi:hypothetical protein
VIEQDSTEQDGRADFDFFIGRWKQRHRRLKERLKGSNEWEEFGGMLVCHKILGGLGNMEECTLERASGIVQGMTVRLFDPKARQWSLYWADSANGWNWSLPEIGSFKDGRGEFYAHEPFGEGRYIFSRYIWTPINETSCRWEQAFSTDGGKTWETNMITDHIRVE